MRLITQVSSVGSLSLLYLDLFCNFPGLKMCMTFGSNPQIIFCHIFCSLNLVNFGSTSTEAYRHWVSCERNSFTIVPITFLTLQVFCKGLYACDLDVTWTFHYNGNVIWLLTFSQMMIVQ